MIKDRYIFDLFKQRNIDRIIKKRTTPDKRKLIYVSFKGLNESYNRWIEKPEEK